ncbi:hypothetical protein TIFTF001_030601 [Ficus carica]|uniref:Uncharacterized protein n=1 Tax=Ficus carica TaxID=3494 RepID=A0AA88DTJ0_FICCA|nr:hypothetical protein TIFTF001_030601 [Ficus carica]
MESPSPPAATITTEPPDRESRQRPGWRLSDGDDGVGRPWAIDLRRAGKNPSVGSALPWRSRSRSGRRWKACVVGEEIGGCNASSSPFKVAILAVVGWILVSHLALTTLSRPSPETGFPLSSPMAGGREGWCSAGDLLFLFYLKVFFDNKA